MKELSIEEKAKRYDEVIEKAKSKVLYPDKPCFVDIKEIFPELKESEDERIREAIYNCVKWFGFDSCFFKDVSQEECIAWLKKQDQVKESPISQHENKTCKENGNSLTSEDERTRNRIIKVLSAIPDKFFSNNSELQDMIAWLKKQGSIGKINEKLRQYREYLIKEIERWHKKEEDEILSKIGKQDCIGHANAYISARVEFEEIFDYDSWPEKQGEQKQELLTKEKALKNSPFVEQKPAWSEEDESRITVICTYLQDYARLSGSESRTIRINEYCDWLKSIRPQNRWKPSDEQMKALLSKLPVIKGNGDKVQNILESLYQDLKKLREE